MSSQSTIPYATDSGEIKKAASWQLVAGRHPFGQPDNRSGVAALVAFVSSDRPSAITRTELVLKDGTGTTV